MSESVAGKIVIITGSSMGIGKALAIWLGKRGAKIIINARNEIRLQEAEAELKALGIEVFSYAGDITQPPIAEGLIQFTIKQFGALDILVNNAGTSMRGRIESVSADVLKHIYEINTIAPIMLTQMAIPYIKKQKGSIVFISSLAGLKGLPFISIYCSAKMGLTAIADALRIEHREDKIHVGLVYVGITAVENGKTTIGPNGEFIPLDERKGWHVASLEHVAQKIALNIMSRKNKTIIGLSGKIYYNLVRIFPTLADLLTRKTYKKQKQLYS